MTRLVVMILALLFVLPSAAQTPSDEAANRLFVEAVQFWTRAQELQPVADDPVAWQGKLDIVLHVDRNMRAIVDRYPGSSLAVRLVLGERIGDKMSLKQVAEALASVRDDLDVATQRAGAQRALSALRPALVRARGVQDGAQRVEELRRLRAQLGEISIRYPRANESREMLASLDGEIDRLMIDLDTTAASQALAALQPALVAADALPDIALRMNELERLRSVIAAIANDHSKSQQAMAALRAIDSEIRQLKDRLAVSAAERDLGELEDQIAAARALDDLPSRLMELQRLKPLLEGIVNLYPQLGAQLAELRKIRSEVDAITRRYSRSPVAVAALRELDREIEHRQANFDQSEGGRLLTLLEPELANARSLTDLTARLAELRRLRPKISAIAGAYPRAQHVVSALRMVDAEIEQLPVEIETAAARLALAELGLRLVRTRELADRAARLVAPDVANKAGASLANVEPELARLPGEIDAAQAALALADLQSRAAAARAIVGTAERVAELQRLKPGFQAVVEKHPTVPQAKAILAEFEDEISRLLGEVEELGARRALAELEPRLSRARQTPDLGARLAALRALRPQFDDVVRSYPRAAQATSALVALDAELIRLPTEITGAEDRRKRDAAAAEERRRRDTAAAEEQRRREATEASKLALVGRVFRDCPDCPELVGIPAGFARLASGRDVTIASPFAVGKFEVTFEEWDACVAQGGCAHRPDDRRWGRSRQPVMNVSWDDAQAYVAWLSRKTGKSYRLPSEAEWEYAAQAGTGQEQLAWRGTNQSNCDRCGSRWDNKQTAPVGSFAANAFGLHDMLGNVWEWTADCWNEGYPSALIDGAALKSGDCSRRVLRGGSWYSLPDLTRSAFRDKYSAIGRSDINGFRVMRNF